MAMTNCFDICGAKGNPWQFETQLFSHYDPIANHSFNQQARCAVNRNNQKLQCLDFTFTLLHLIQEIRFAIKKSRAQ
jgi:hypothetical protein